MATKKNQTKDEQLVEDIIEDTVEDIHEELTNLYYKYGKSNSDVDGIIKLARSFGPKVSPDEASREVHGEAGGPESGELADLFSRLYKALNK